MEKGKTERGGEREIEPVGERNAYHHMYRTDLLDDVLFCYCMSCVYVDFWNINNIFLSHFAVASNQTHTIHTTRNSEHIHSTGKPYFRMGERCCAL